MAQYKCENCNELRDSAVCPKCGADTHLLGEEPSLDHLASRVSRNAAAVETKALVLPPPREKGRRPDPVPHAESTAAAPAEESDRAAPPPAAPPTETKKIIGLDEFHALLDRQMKAVIMCGRGHTGKSEIAAGYIRANTVYRGQAQNLTLRAVLRTEASLGGTAPEEVWYQIIDRKRMFLDPSGEFFKRLSPDERQRLGLVDVKEEDFHFMQRAVAALAGVVLVVDLTATADQREHNAWRLQEEDLKFVLSALRWLRWDKEARPPVIGMSTNIAQRVSMFPRIDKRVLVLFSKADQLTKFTNERPLDFARRRLPTLHAALLTHAHRFRYDFCNTMIKTPSGGDQTADPCGVLLPITWLLDESFAWLPLQMPTGWIGGAR